MVTASQDIRVVVSSIFQGEAFKKASSALQSLTQRIAAVNRLSNTAATAFSRMTGIVTHLTNGIGRVGLVLNNLGANLARVAVVLGGSFAIAAGVVINIFKTLFSVIKGVLQQLKRFRPEFLSLLFISLILNRVFGKMVQSISEVFGVGELLNILFIDLLLPAFEAIFPFLIEILDWFLNLPEPAKKVIGTLILVGFAFSHILGALSQVILLFSGFGFSVTSLLLLLTPFVAAVGGAGGMIAILGENAEEAKNSFIDLVRNGVQFVVDWINRLGEFFLENQERIRVIASDIMNALINGLLDILNALGRFVQPFLTTLRQVFEDNQSLVVDVAQTIVSMIVQVMTTFLPVLVQFGADLLVAIIQGIQENKESVMTAVTEMINVIGNSIVTIAPILVEFATDILEVINEGIKENKDILIDSVSTIVESLQEIILQFKEPLAGIGETIAEILVTGIRDYIVDNLSTIVGAVLGGIAGAAVGGPVGAAAGAVAGGSFLTPPEGGPVHFQRGGLVPGNIGQPVPVIAHGGERITPANRVRSSEGVIINQTITVTVSDRREFEELIKRNNNKLTEDIRRLAQRT